MSKKKTPKPSGPFAKLAELKNKMAAEEPKPAPPKREVPRQSAPDEDEALTFHRMMSGVVPLDRSHSERIASGQKAQMEENIAAHQRLRELAFGVERFEVTDDGQHVEGRRVDVPHDQVRKLRRGLLPIDARLDLHGMRAEEAREALFAFLRDKRARSERCVLVIHGRGEHSPGPPVLRGEISAWLSQGASSEYVAAFATATDADGGPGALYVLLRR